MSNSPQSGTVSAYTLAQIVAVAEDVKRYKSKSYVEAAQVLASHVLANEVAEHRKLLKTFIERIAAAGPDERDAVIAEALTAVKAMQ